MEIRKPTDADWRQFFALAEQEGWRVPEGERRLFRGAWRQNALVLIDADRFCGLVTAVAHEKSGWIGNLIVPAERRGLGYGGRLFRAALAALVGQGIASVWLTASLLGRPLYEKEGFVAVDRIERWVLASRQSRPARGGAEEPAAELLPQLDRRSWGEDRQVLLTSLLDCNPVFRCGDSAVLLQQEPAMQIAGPWYSDDLCVRSNRVLLQRLLDAADPAKEIVIDLLASTPVRCLVAAAGFELSGENALMVYGEAPAVDLEKMVALASLGSVG